MLSVYDLYDLSYIFKNIRAFPNYSLNHEVLKKTFGVLSCKEDTYHLNRFRFSLNSIINIDKEKYCFAFVENFYVYFPSFLKNEGVCNLLASACYCLLNSIEENNTEKIIDLADCLHNLPIEICENHFTVPRKFWGNEIKFYRNKWDKDFLKKEQKLLN